MSHRCYGHHQTSFHRYDHRRMSFHRYGCRRTNCCRGLGLRWGRLDDCCFRTKSYRVRHQTMMKSDDLSRSLSLMTMSYPRYDWVRTCCGACLSLSLSVCCQRCSASCQRCCGCCSRDHCCQKRCCHEKKLRSGDLNQTERCCR